MSDDENFDNEDEFGPPDGGDEGEEQEQPKDDDDAEEGKEKGEEEEGGEEEEDELEKMPDNPLTEELIAEGLALLCKTGDGLAHAYVRLDVQNKELTDVSILKTFIHLRYVDITGNFIKDIYPLNSLTHLLTLKADGNRITQVRLEEMPFLQTVNFNNNQIKLMEGLSHPLLEQLSLNFNKITLVSGLEPEKLTRLHTLEIRGNQLKSTMGINLPNLKNLFIAANKLTRIEGLENMEQLATLHLRENQINTLDGFSANMKNLQYINLRTNSIQNIKEEVAKLDVLPKLRAVVLTDNPVAEEEDYRSEVLIALRRLERLDKEQYTDEERKEAQETYATRKKEQEEAAKLAAEAEAEAGGGAREFEIPPEEAESTEEAQDND